jgi:hypothetical protein
MYAGQLFYRDPLKKKNCSTASDGRGGLIYAHLHSMGHVVHRVGGTGSVGPLRLPAVGTLKGYSKALEYEYIVKTAALATLKRYSIISFPLYLE